MKPQFGRVERHGEGYDEPATVMGAPIPLEHAARKLLRWIEDNQDKYGVWTQEMKDLRAAINQNTEWKIEMFGDPPLWIKIKFILRVLWSVIW